MLELEGVSKSYKKKMAVNQISLKIEEGDSIGVVGSNGAGKSTLLGIIATVIKPDSGKVIYKGNNVIKSPEFIRREMGYVPQDIAVYSELSGKDNLKFWGRAYHLYGDSLKHRIEELGKVMDMDSKQMDMPVKSYSGGMKRRLNIGVALLHRPRIVVLDEPTVGLDEASRNNILQMITRLTKEGVTVIYTGHYMDEVDLICNKKCVLEAGRLLSIEIKEK